MRQVIRKYGIKFLKLIIDRDCALLVFSQSERECLYYQHLSFTHYFKSIIFVAVSFPLCCNLTTYCPLATDFP